VIDLVGMGDHLLVKKGLKGNQIYTSSLRIQAAQEWANSANSCTHHGSRVCSEWHRKVQNAPRGWSQDASRQQ
jgi:hypothetical protein